MSVKFYIIFCVNSIFLKQKCLSVLNSPGNALTLSPAKPIALNPVFSGILRSRMLTRPASWTLRLLPSFRHLLLGGPAPGACRIRVLKPWLLFHVAVHDKTHLWEGNVGHSLNHVQRAVALEFNLNEVKRVGEVAEAVASLPQHLTGAGENKASDDGGEEEHKEPAVQRPVTVGAQRSSVIVGPDAVEELSINLA